VEDYLARGFDQLTVAFGCTGGQHRSVYAANKLADFLKTKYGIAVNVTHTNEKKWLLSADANTEAESQ
jgi:RNase adaptor protein for sRNA GlmZ degradation